MVERLVISLRGLLINKLASWLVAVITTRAGSERNRHTLSLGVPADAV